MAPKRPKKAVKLPQNSDYTNLTLKNVLCPICRSILIEPVTLPCDHGFCLSCFQSTMANANLVCPLCRVRIGSWLRKMEKQKQLVNSLYWKAIQETFPEKVKNRIEGVEENVDDEDEEVQVKLAEPGEIRKEYEIQRLNEEIEGKKRRDAEIRASEELIQKIKQEEEYRQLVEEEKIKYDQQIAKQLAKDLSDPGPSAKQGPLDKFLKLKNIKPIENNTNSSKNFSVYVMNMKRKKNFQMRKILPENETSDSNDSIGSECRYFKPIDHKNIPQVKSSPIKIPSKIVSASAVKFGAPNGSVKFKHNNDLSPFLPLSSSSQLKLGCHKNNDVLKKSNCNGQIQPATNTSKRKKRKKSDENTVTTKKTKNDEERESPAFLGFSENEINTRLKIKRLINGQNVCSKSVCDNLEDDEIRRKLKQEQDDLEFAKKLQEELNRTDMNRYSTRFSITRNKKKSSRQITLDEIIKPNCQVNI